MAILGHGRRTCRSRRRRTHELLSLSRIHPDLLLPPLAYASNSGTIPPPAWTMAP
jgi:hypothetical protein